MPCEFLRNPDGTHTVLCGRTRPKPEKLCADCQQARVTRLCDFPLHGRKAGKTCERPICDRCARTVHRKDGDTVDYCRAHAAQLTLLEVPP